MIVGSIKTRSRSKEGTNKLILGHWLHSLGRLDVRLKRVHIVLDDIVSRARSLAGQHLDRLGAKKELPFYGRLTRMKGLHAGGAFRCAGRGLTRAGT